MTSLEMVIIVARKLGSLRDEVAFLGGATTSFLITDRHILRCGPPWMWT